MRSFTIMAAMLSLAVPWPGRTAGTLVSPGSLSTPKPKPVTRPAAPVRSDAEIEKDIRNRFSKSKIGAEKYQVHVQGGVATIEGKTDVIQHKGVATRLARLGGATGVKNQIQISEAAKQKAAQNLATGRRRAQVKRGDARSEPRSQNMPNSRQISTWALLLQLDSKPENETPAKLSPAAGCGPLDESRRRTNAEERALLLWRRVPAATVRLPAGTAGPRDRNRACTEPSAMT
jgi:hypothetical protein